MLATEPRKPHPIQHLKPTIIRRPLQPKNTLTTLTPTHINKTPQLPFTHVQTNKENFDIVANPVEAVGASLAEELSAVRKKLERLRVDKEKTEKMLQEREKMFDFQMFELEERGEFQKELENEVDRLYRLKQLKLVTKRMSPLRSLREKVMEKKSKEAQFDSTRKYENKEEMVDQSSTTKGSSLILERSWLSTSESSSCASASTSVSKSNSTATSKLSLISSR